MTYAARVQTWNDWYDGLPDRWRFQVVLWPLLLVGTINMLLTIASGFPFGLLVILAILVIAFVRVPHKAGWVHAEASEVTGRSVNLGRVDWAWRLNERYDALPEWRRFWVIPAVLIVAGAINMALTLAFGFPFALLFLLALLAVIALRAPFVWGWLTPPSEASAGSGAKLRVTHDPALAVPALANAEPAAVTHPVPHAAPDPFPATLHEPRPAGPAPETDREPLRP